MSTQIKWDESTSLVDVLLDEQQHLTAVDEFSSRYKEAGLDSSRYESLIPSSLPGDFQQFAFRVDLEACTGCKACVTACHNMNGLDEGETWRKVGLIEGEMPTASGAAQAVHQQTVTSACHHCEDPGCLAGCPVQAYEKDPTTGIVRHLDDQCIGCRYCQLMCPYDVPTYSERLGIVRKCDMCHERLAAGEAPACVQGCPNEAISIAIVDTRGASTTIKPPMLNLATGALPHGDLTTPTTRYVSDRPLGEALEPTGLTAPRPAHAHDPLAVMLVLTQASIGLVLFDTMSSLVGMAFGSAWHPSWILITMATVIGLIGLSASVFHLGRPQWAFRAILGLRTSWMSREIVALGGFAGLLVATCAIRWLNWGLANEQIPNSLQLIISLGPLAGIATCLAGLLGLYCSVMIYAVTGRPLWRFDRTARRFLSTSIWAALAAAPMGILACVDSAVVGRDALMAALSLGLMALTIARFRSETNLALTASTPEEFPSLKRSIYLLEGALAPSAAQRRKALSAAGLFLPAVHVIALGLGAPTTVLLGISLLILGLGICSDLIERSLFFRSEAMPSMPGVE